MKVALVSPLPPPSGGMASWTVDYMQYAENVGIEAYVVNTALIGERAQRKSKSLGIIQELKRTASIVMQLRQVIRMHQVDIVHLNTPCSTLGMFRDLLCLRVSRKTTRVIQCHCNVQDWVGDKWISRFLLRSIVKNSERVLVLNRKSSAFVERITGKTPERVPNFLKRISQEEHVIQRHIQNVVYVGQVKREKGILELLDAAKAMPQITFRVIGPVQNEINQLENSSNVMFLGEKSHEVVEQELEKADVFLFPSHSEGFSVALLEAMNAGLPVITTDVGANADMIELKGGIVVAPKNAGQIIDALQSMADQETRREMSVWNQRKVANEYSIDSVMRRMYNIYMGS